MASDPAGDTPRSLPSFVALPRLRVRPRRFQAHRVDRPAAGELDYLTPRGPCVRATIDAQGYRNIVGRSKDLVIRGGENIYPGEVENYLHRHPKVLDAQCIGVPDARYGEELCACIVPRPGAHVDAEEIRAFCRGEIAHYKVPRYVVFVDTFPMTITGKIQKFLLRERMTEFLGLQEQVTA